MLAKCEWRKYENNEQVWVGKYANLSNLPHWHYDCEIIFVERGGALVCVDGNELTLFEGQSVFINSKQIHYINARQDSVLSFILFDNKLTSGITDKYALKTPLLSRDYAIGQAYNTISAELKNKCGFYSQMVNQVIVSLVIGIFRSEEISAETNNLQNSDRFGRLLDDIDENYSFYTFEKAVEFMALSAPYFSKKFHSLFGMTFSQYMNLVRVEKAIECIRNNGDNLSIAQIADLCGFDTIRNFNRVFASVTGYSPSKLPDSFDIMFIRQVNNDSPFNPTQKQSIRLE